MKEEFKSLKEELFKAIIDMNQNNDPDKKKLY